MKQLKTFGMFWYDFIVGDDWRLAAGVVTVVAFVFVLAHHGLDVWWLLPLAIPPLLAVSLLHATKQRRPPGP